MRNRRLACCVGLTDISVYNHLMPLALHPGVDEIHLFRRTAQNYRHVPKEIGHIAPMAPKYRQLSNLYRECRRLIDDGHLVAGLSFNPLPYGLILAIAARDRGIPIHFGFVGSDWYGRKQRFVRPFILPFLKKASLITVPGDGMKLEMTRRGVAEERIRILPHCIDVSQFPENNWETAVYDMIYVGRLTRIKRVDLIIKAFSILHQSDQNLRLCIVGDGPLATELKTMAGKLGITESIEFTGQTDNVGVYLRQSRILVLASDSEGLPFVLIEGMCSGLVPVSTDVGTIRELIKNGENGFLVDRRDLEMLTAKLQMLISDRELYRKCRHGALRQRTNSDYSRATAVWDSWLSTVV